MFLTSLYFFLFFLISQHLWHEKWEREKKKEKKHLREQKVEPIKEVPQAFVGEIFFFWEPWANLASRRFHGFRNSCRKRELNNVDSREEKPSPTPWNVSRTRFSFIFFGGNNFSNASPTWFAPGLHQTESLTKQVHKTLLSQTKTRRRKNKN